MKKSKYIIIEYMGFEIPIVFSPLIQHVDIGFNKKVISAGFCVLEDGIWDCFGKSVGLNLHSRPEDKEILTNNLGMDNLI